ncbi:MAG TPA: serine/threonine-protein kinase [Burkholderiales bacterium]|nr:serine/threonine-protein kinase [Burkholderiales bacterium]
METQYGKYELKRPLGTGGSGTVYCAVDTFSGKDVALKIFDRKALDDSQVGERTRSQFMKEASLAGTLAHPHIISIFEAMVREDDGYVAMEYVPGGNLLRHTKPDALLPVSDVIQIGFKSCSALDYAFRRGIVHRDIKPANILIVDGTNIKVADFGSALLRAVDAPSDRIIGTPSYMSPEQLSGRPLTAHSDMYAMGVVLYELLTGQRPFGGKTMEELFHRIKHDEPAPPSALRSEVPVRLDSIILKMLSKRPQDRYPTWADLALELAEVGKLSVYQREVPDSEKFGLLRKSEVFEQVNDAQLWELVHSSRWRRLPPRSTVLSENDSGYNMYLLASGELKITRRGRLLNVLKGGECFGEMAYIHGGSVRRQATAEAITDVLIAEFDRSAMDCMSEGCRLKVAQGLLRTLAERLALGNDRVSRTV